MATEPSISQQKVAEKIGQAIHTMVPAGYGFVVLLASPKAGAPGIFDCVHISNLPSELSMDLLKITIKDRDTGYFSEKELPHE